MHFVENAFGLDHGRVEIEGVEEVAAWVEDMEDTELWYAAPAARNKRR
jgi:hypothetical protein